MLNGWLSQYDKLELMDAQELCRKALESNDEIKRKEYMDKVVLGTLNVVYNYVKRNELFVFANGVFDEDDIISSFVEIWVKKIYSGVLLNINRYSEVLNRTFVSEVYQNLVGTDTLVSEIIGMRKVDFVNLFYAFIQFKNKGLSFNFDDLINYVSKDKSDYWDLIQRYDSKVMVIFENIYDNLNFDKDEVLDLSIRKINSLVKVLISIGVTESISDDLIFDVDMEQSVLNKLALEALIKEFDTCLNNDIHRQVIHDILDDGDFKTLGEIVKMYNISKDRVRQIDGKSLSLIKRSK